MRPVKVTVAQRGLACFLGVVRAICLLAIVLFPVGAAIPGAYSTVNLPVHIKDNSLSSDNTSLRCTGSLSGRYTGPHAAICEARSHVSVTNGTYEVADNDGVGDFALAMLPMLLGLGIVWYATTMLLGVLESMRFGDPFHKKNAERLRRAALAVGVGGVVVSGLLTFAAHQIIDASVLNGFSPRFFPYAWVALLIGAILGTVAEVFRRGAEIREELEGVV